MKVDVPPAMFDESSVGLVLLRTEATMRGHAGVGGRGVAEAEWMWVAVLGAVAELR